MVRFLVAVMFLTGTVLEPKSCSVNFGGGSDDPSAPSGFTLAVPFFYQSPQYCGPASVEMWAAYDGVTATQQQIANYIGCGVNGSTQEQIVNGVEHFTVSGRDAALVYNAGEGTQGSIAGQYFSAEITSITARIPLIPLVNGATHAGVLIGGQWHIDSDSGLYVWDSVLFNDPAVGPGRPFIASDWTGYDDVEHIISSSASAKGGSNYWTYHSEVGIRGAGGGFQRLPY